MGSLTKSPLQFQAATKNHLGGVLRRRDNRPSQSMSEESPHEVVKSKSEDGQHNKPQDFKVDLGLFSRSLSGLGYFHNLHFFPVVKTRTGPRRKDSVRILRRKMLWKVVSRNMEKEEKEMETCFSGKTNTTL